MPANIELNTVSYILLTTIFSAASVIAIKHGKQADAHPLVMISQAEFSPLRYPRESAIIKSKLFPGGAPILNTSERGSITTLSDMYQIALLKRKSIWLGKQWKVDLHSRTIWVIFLYVAF
jgi:long-chain acyl-CoA synthetase